MINILLSGCNGKMGQVIARIAKHHDDVCIAAGYDLNNTIENEYVVYSDLKECTEHIDVIVDFSNPAALSNVLDFAVLNKTPLVVATTGLSDMQISKLDENSKSIPIFFSANMSIGINLITDLVKRAAESLNDGFDIEIIEKHHNRKVDAPSGTALSIAKAINSVSDNTRELVCDRHLQKKKRSADEIGIHSVRGGTIVGVHEVIFAGIDEIIEIKHTAMSRDIFAEGAIRAAKFICNKKANLYNMQDLLSENT